MAPATKFYLVSAEALPEIFIKVAEAKRMQVRHVIALLCGKGRVDFALQALRRQRLKRGAVLLPDVAHEARHLRIV